VINKGVEDHVLAKLALTNLLYEEIHGSNASSPNYRITKIKDHVLASITSI
jgi:hypothetical protein